MKTSFFILLMLIFSCKQNNENIFITPNEIIQGDNIDIVIKNLKVNTKYKLSLQLLKYSQDYVFTSSASFISDRNGVINIYKDKSISGSFIGKDSLGLFYSLDTASNVLKPFLDIRDIAEYEDDFHKYLIQVELNNEIIAKKEFKTIFKAASIETIKIEKNTTKLNLYKANDSKNIALILGGSEGNNAASSYLAELLASKGFNTAAISYFGNAAQGYNLREVPIERIDSAILKIEKEIGSLDKIIIMGYSKGAELALLYASKRKRINSVIAFAPSNVIWQGLGGVKKSSWTENGKEVEFLPFADSYKTEFHNGRSSFKALHLKSLLNCKKKYEIEVEKINGDILLFSGKEDLMWPSSIMSDSIESRLYRNNFTHKFESYQFPKVGHFVSFLNYNSTRNFGRYAIGGDIKEVAYSNLQIREIIIKYLNNKLNKN